MPFPDNYFDYVYCSPVIEDFWEPMIIVDELIRICKVGGKIELRAPTEMNLHLTNPYHKIPFTLSKFSSLASPDSPYGKKCKLKIYKLEYYSGMNKGVTIKGTLFYNFIDLIVQIYNLLPYQLVERTFIKYIFGYLNCKIIYTKIK